MEKTRLDVLLVERGFFTSRERARKAIMKGTVTVEGETVTKPGNAFFKDSVIEVKEDQKYVSRGGYKLEKAILEFGMDLQGKVCMDIGASTGGFTDCMLKNGAAKVYAVDVGYGQLDRSLGADKRVISMEKINARYLEKGDFPEEISFASVDVSFISLEHIFPALGRIGVEEVISLIKPQFEAGRKNVGKGGIVKDRNVHRKVLEDVIEKAGKEGYFAYGITFSPIRGQDGNIEFLGYFTREEKPFDMSLIADVVERAHSGAESMTL